MIIERIKDTGIFVVDGYQYCFTTEHEVIAVVREPQANDIFEELLNDSDTVETVVKAFDHAAEYYPDLLAIIFYVCETFESALAYKCMLPFKDDRTPMHEAVADLMDNRC